MLLYYTILKYTKFHCAILYYTMLYYVIKKHIVFNIKYYFLICYI